MRTSLVTYTGNLFIASVALGAVVPSGFCLGRWLGGHALENRRRIINKVKPRALIRDCEVGKSKKMQRTYRECCAFLEENKKSPNPIVGDVDHYWISRGHFRWTPP